MYILGVMDVLRDTLLERSWEVLILLDRAELCAYALN